MRKGIVLVIAMVTVALFATATFAAVTSSTTVTPVAKKMMGPQVTCPVSNMKANKEIYTDYQGKRIYFCSTDCKDAFAKDPAKYMKVLADKGEQPEATPVPKKY